MKIKRRVFYSFHFKNDVFRVQQIRNIGSFEGNNPVSVNQWETIKKGGEKAIKKWIDDNMAGKSCVVVLIGSDTANRKWVKYEIEKAWESGKPIFGIYIHNLKIPITGTSLKGKNPFDQFTLPNGKSLSTIVKCYSPKSGDAYDDIKSNIKDWIEAAIEQR